MRRWFRFRRDLGLQLLALYLLLIIPFLLTLWVFDGLVGQRIRADVQTSDLALAQAIAQETDLALGNALEMVAGLTEYEGVIAADTGEMAVRFDTILATHPNVNLVYRLDANGMMVYHFPEGRQLFTEMSVEENLEMGAANRRARSKMKSNLEKVYDMFPRLKERRAQKSGTMSGGEQQMLAVGRGIMAEPIVLMVDELSLGLSPMLTLQLFQSMKQLRDAGITVLLVEQNVHMALAISDYGYVLSEGRIKMEGPAKKLTKDEHVRAAYLGL